MATQWIPPLPAGYEARWDPNQRAYFFINHRDKSTSWQDPRYTPHPNQHHAAAQFLSSGTGGYGGGARGAQNIPMTTKNVQFGSTTSSELITEDDEESESETDFDQLFASTIGDHGKKVDVQKLHKLRQMFPSAPEDVIKSFLLRNNNVELVTIIQLQEAGYRREELASHPAPRVVDMTERLRAMFPTANRDLVDDILSQANNDEKKARAQLEAIGYKPTFPATHKDRSRSTSPARAKSPAKTTSPARRTPSPKKPELSEAEKNRLVNKVKGQFKNVDRSVVQMALQVCNYDETRVKAVLDRMADTSRPSSSRPSTSTTRSASPTPQISHNLEPIIFDDTSRPTTPDKGKGSRSTTPGSRPQSKSKSRSPTPKSHKSSTPQQRAKQVTHGQARSVVSRQPRGSSYRSEYRTIPKGPDPSMRVGPNKELLLTDYTQVRGPNPELRQGPDPGRVHGSQGASGPDRSLHCGPQLDLNQGPGVRNPLITAI